MYEWPGVQQWMDNMRQKFFPLYNVYLALSKVLQALSKALADVVVKAPARAMDRVLATALAGDPIGHESGLERRSRAATRSRAIPGPAWSVLERSRGAAGAFSNVFRPPVWFSTPAGGPGGPRWPHASHRKVTPGNMAHSHVGGVILGGY